MKQLRERLQRYFDDMTPGDAARLFLIAGVLVYVVGYLADHVFQWDLPFIAEGYSNAGIELLSIAGTVIVIDSLNQRRANKERLQELITQMSSDDNTLAKAAVDILRLKGWDEDGSLQRAELSGANLQGAWLVGANLEGTNLGRTNLEEAVLVRAKMQGAWLFSAKMQRADLRGASMEGARLNGANLSGAVLPGANLEGAILSEANLQGAVLFGTDVRKEFPPDGITHEPGFAAVAFDEFTTLPDGTKWTLDTDMTRFTDPEHPRFWRSESPQSPAYRGDAQQP